MLISQLFTIFKGYFLPQLPIFGVLTPIRFQVKFTFIVYSLLFVFFSSIVSFSCSSKRKKEAEANQKSAGARPPAPRVDGFVVTTETISENLEIPGSIGWINSILCWLLENSQANRNRVVCKKRNIGGECNLKDR